MLEERVNIVEERVDRLEAILGQFMAQTGTSMVRRDRSIERMEQMIAEMKAEAARDRQNMDTMIAEMKTEAERDRQNMNTMIAEMKAEAEKERRELARQLGDISNRMGTIVEDIIAPSLRRLAVEELGCGDERFFAVRLSKTRADDPGRRREFDAFFVGADAVLLNETKATPRPEYAQDFVEFLRSDEFFLYFPEYKDKPVVPVFSSLHLPEDLVTYLTRQGIYAVAMSDDVMRVLNLEEVRAQ